MFSQPIYLNLFIVPREDNLLVYVPFYMHIDSQISLLSAITVMTNKSCLRMWRTGLGDHLNHYATCAVN